MLFSSDSFAQLKDEELIEGQFFQQDSDDSFDDDFETKEFQIKMQDEEVGTSQVFVSQDKLKSSFNESRYESNGGLKRRPSSEDVLQNLFARTYNMVRIQSKVKLQRQESQEQLQSNYEGNKFWQRQSQKTLGVYISDSFYFKQNIVNDSIQEIIKILDHLLKMHQEDLYNRITQTIKELRTVDCQLKIVKELLVNCHKEATKKLIELKSDLKPLSKNISIIRAEKSSDVNVMMLNFIRDYLIDRLLPSLLNLCQKTLYNEVAIDQIQLSSDLGVTNSRLRMINMLFCTAVDMSKKDLFSLDKTNKDWKKLYEATTFKSLGDPDKINKSFDNFAKVIMMGHAMISSKSKYQNSFLKKLMIVYSAVSYLLSERLAMQHAMNHISDMKVDNAIELMNLVDQPGIRNIMQLGFPNIAYNKKIYIHPIVEPITIENMNKEINDGTINKITEKKLLMVNQELHNSEYCRQELFTKSKSKLKIRVLCNEILQNPQKETYNDMTDDELGFGFFRCLQKKFNPIQQNQDKIFDTIMIHIHGGGFISQSSSTHQCHTREWAIKLGIPIFSIDYSLAPKNPYPAALDDCWQAYHWIMTNASKYFNINPKVVLVGGDSAGGALTIALTGLLIKYKQRVPDGIFVAYPATDMRLCYSPSYLNSLTDKILSHTMIGICIHSYAANPLVQIQKDPFMSPVMLSDEIHRQFPPARIVCGTMDPLVDNSWRFASRLEKAGVDFKITMYEEISHGFLNYNTINGMKEVKVCLDDSVVHLQELIDIAKHVSPIRESFDPWLSDKLL